MDDNIIRTLISVLSRCDKDKLDSGIKSLNDSEKRYAIYILAKLVGEHDWVDLMSYEIKPFAGILTSAEAEDKWGLKRGTIRSACSRGRLQKYIGTEVKETGKTWLLTENVMYKEYGEPKNE